MSITLNKLRGVVNGFDDFMKKKGVENGEIEVLRTDDEIVFILSAPEFDGRTVAIGAKSTKGV